MISYELAKELKDAGFPQELGNADLVVSDGGEVVDPKSISFLPTLSELIEACGEKFGRLEALHNQNRWLASAPWVTPGGYDTDGVTPEEAVARLWLALNKI